MSNGKLEYVNDATNYSPDFISGIRYKITQYDKGPYYPLVWRHFRRNLHQSNVLIVIGYGFGDSKVNERIEEFVYAENKTMLVIDTEKKDIKYFQRNNVHYVDGGVSDMDANYILHCCGIYILL